MGVPNDVAEFIKCEEYI